MLIKNENMGFSGYDHNHKNHNLKLNQHWDSVLIMAEPYFRIYACYDCGCVYSKRKASKCPVCNSYVSTPIENPTNKLTS